MDQPIRIFIGFDPREAVTYYTCQQSILEHTDAEVSFHPVRGAARDGSNAFTYARFLVPYRCHFQGMAVFLDGDMILRDDIRNLIAAAPALYTGVSVVKHDYQTQYPIKYLGNKNEDYPRKNWSSVVVWNCGFYPNRVLTPEFVAKHDGAFLHRFGWLRDDQIGGLPMRWNRLVLEQPVEERDALLHFTIGAPCFDDYAECSGADEWFATLERALSPLQR